MTNAEVKALKPGDYVNIYWVVEYRGKQLGGVNGIQIETIVRRVVSDCARAAGHVWAVVTAKGSDKQWVIESDEYLQAMGFEPIAPGWPGAWGAPGKEPERKLGAVKA